MLAFGRSEELGDLLRSIYTTKRTDGQSSVGPYTPSCFTVVWQADLMGRTEAVRTMINGSSLCREKSRLRQGTRRASLMQETSPCRWGAIPHSGCISGPSQDFGLSSQRNAQLNNQQVFNASVSDTLSRQHLDIEAAKNILKGCGLAFWRKFVPV